MSLQTSTPARRHHPPRLLALLLLGFAMSLPMDEARAQKPWEGWYGPLADGMLDFRFGMDKETVRETAQMRKVRALSARPSTLRYSGTFLSLEGELLLTFAPNPALGGRPSLCAIRLDWVGIPVGGGRPQAMFEALDEFLQQEYGPTVYRRDATMSEIATGYKDTFHVYEGPEMQAQLSLSDAGGEAIRLMLLLISPQLDPRFTP